MTIGASLVLIAIGAILKFAVTQQVNGINLSTVGVILMIVGAAGLLIGLIMIGSRRRSVLPPDSVTYVDTPDITDRRI